MIRADPLQGRTSRGSLLRSFVGIDVAKLKNAIAIAEIGRFFREVDATATGIHRLVERIASRFVGVQLCYEAGPIGCGLNRLILSLAMNVPVGAPSRT
ncbi:hypothetical protein [Bradyrhizobium elkanii]|uniref:hypothetical protein n=1 Tax=Bradyrhizobium elkanii TaxID=29448 RepID=UPI000F73C118|nr:hypothetical protein [Bradyrhizobium elkanii]MCS4074564.1 hypothetical protein [Bradyrhizobium elkanii]MCS4081201.1 hypothetical protein [Bradyrhizobium elkanii]MDH6692784.1 hypothetical protein [Bradyrhizobium elkanii]NWL67057.1 hypothetical protein [Bradyrhizobium elkanii]